MTIGVTAIISSDRKATADTPSSSGTGSNARRQTTPAVMLLSGVRSVGNVVRQCQIQRRIGKKEQIAGAGRVVVVGVAECNISASVSSGLGLGFGSKGWYFEHGVRISISISISTVGSTIGSTIIVTALVRLTHHQLRTESVPVTQSKGHSRYVLSAEKVNVNNNTNGVWSLSRSHSLGCGC